MSPRPLVSYVIPYYNGHAHLAETIDSALTQTLSDVEAIVVDDGSPVGCEDIVQTFGDRVRLIRTVNHGVSGARNVGLEHARGEFVTWLDQDDIAYPDHAEHMSAPLRSDPRLDGTYCTVQIFGEDTPGEEERFDRYSSALELFKTRMILSMGALMFRRSSLDGLGGFDLTVSNIGEDWDFCLRFARFRRLQYVPEPLFGFRRHPAQASRGADRMAKGALGVLRKHWLYSGPGALTRQEMRTARAGIMGYWAEWHRARLKEVGGVNRATLSLALHLVRNPALLPFIVIPPIRRVARFGRPPK